MKKRFWLLLIVLLSLPGLGGSGAADTLRVMSFNIRTLSPDDGRDFWLFRKGEVAALILRHDPDLIGMQEVYSLQARNLESLLPAYDWFGPPRDDGVKRGERCPIFYKRERFELLDFGAFWLSETPEVPGSISWDSACRRVVTWGKFKDLRSGLEFYFFNTHFDHLGKTARRQSARLVAESVPRIAGDAPVIMTGDFNMTDDSEPYATMTGFLADSRLACETAPAGPEATSRDFRPGAAPKKRIDYIFVSEGVKVENYAALDDTYGKDRRPSDHMPVMVTVRLPG